MSRIEDIASRFVDLANKYDKWTGIEQLSLDEINVFFEVVSAAGFEAQEVILGKLVGYYLDQDGSKTGETYPINSFCPFKVVSEGGNNYPATGWLNQALRCTKRGESREKIIETICSEIERSIPLQPVQLTSERDFLIESSPSLDSNYFVDHTRDNHELGCCVGVHKYCRGFIDRNRATEMHDALVCRRCHLRILFPKETETYGELRQALSSEHVQVS